MPFGPGEEVNLRFIGDPETAVFRFLGQAYTVANGGLERKRKSALHPTIRLPRTPGKYAYEFETDGEVTRNGHLRVTRHQRRAPAVAIAPPADDRPTGVRVRRAGSR